MIDKLIATEIICIILAVLVVYMAYNFNTMVNGQVDAMGPAQCYKYFFDEFGNLKHQGIGKTTNILNITLNESD